MSAHAANPLADTPAPNVRLDIHTSDYRVSGVTASRFSRVALVAVREDEG